MEVTVQDNLKTELGKRIAEFENQKRMSEKCEVTLDVIELHSKIIQHFQKVLHVLETGKLSLNYVNHFNNELAAAANHFPYRTLTDEVFSRNEPANIKRVIESHARNMRVQLEQLEFNYKFFEKLDFLKGNLVAVGANGSGKTTLSNGLKLYLPQSGVVVSAQKVLIVPTFGSISNYTTTAQKLKSTQQADKSLKITYSTDNNGSSYHILNQLGGELEVLLDNLLAERNALRNSYVEAAIRKEQNIEIPFTKLDRALQIWNSLIQHRIMEINDGINITLKPLNGSEYPAHQMSDGEKVVLYLVAQVLQAPESGFIIVDEPEMYLHKTILNKLWNTLERERPDCIFVYLTHDLDFAVSRPSARKIWLRSFKHPDKWEVENIIENEIPEALLLELLGSRKDILFCEGTKGKMDEKIYNILFPQYTVCPVEGCLSVISYTKVFNKLPGSLVKAIGLIDKDHHSPERLASLKVEGIHSFSMTEPENLLLDEDFIRLAAKQILVDESVVEQIKNDVIQACQSDIEVQSANYVTAKINYHFNDSHVSKGNSLSEVTANYKSFTDKILLDKWYQERVALLESLIAAKDYKSLLGIFNHKGLKRFVNAHFKITNFSDLAIKLLLCDPVAQTHLKKYFPAELH